MSARFDLVIFDCDGVLVDSEPLTNQVMVENLAGYGLVMTADEAMARFMGGTMKGVMEQARKMGAPLPDDWLDEIYGAMFERLAAEVELVPGVDGVLDALDHAAVPYAVGSNGPHNKMAITLRRTGLWDRLSGRLFSGYDVARPKPAPDVYLAAAAALGIPPARCAVVEDSASGAKAGKAAGMTTFGFVKDTPRANLDPICDALFSDMRDLPGHLGVA